MVCATAVRKRFHPKTVDIWLPSGRKPRLPDGRGLLTVIAGPTADRGVAVLIGGELMGVLGALVAIPIAGSLQLVVRELRTGVAPPAPPLQPEPEPDAG